MAAFGQINPQRALSSAGREVKYGPLYPRSISLKEVNVDIPLDSRPCLTRTEETFEGWLQFSHDDEKGCILRGKSHGPYCKGVFLDKVCTDYGCMNKFLISEEFFPPLKRLLQKKMNWGTDFLFRGLADFYPRLIEWTEEILRLHEDTLRQAGIYGLVAISCYPYMYQKDVWRAFCELWSPLTNTFHHGGGEMGMSLHDLKQIGGLPILGEPYEEFLPPNKSLNEEAQYPPTVLELLRIHAMLCRHYNRTEIPWWMWLSHFYRGELIFEAFGNNSEVRRKKKGNPKQSSPIRKESLPLYVSKQGALAAYLAYMLSRFVLPHGPKVVRPETFVMACFMAQSRRISLAPTVLGHIYHGLGDMATHKHPGRANPNFGIHFVIGWLGEYFDCLYPRRPDSDFSKKLPLLSRYAGINGNLLKMHEVRLVFRHSKYVSYRAVLFGDKDDDLDYLDSSDLSDASFEKLLCIRSSILPVRLGSTMILQPYYPNRFAREFGFEQGVPSNGLKFSFSQRSRRSIEDISYGYARLFRRHTGALFHIPRSYHLGKCTWDYCGWWAMSSSPYLSQSIYKVNTILTGKEGHLKDPVYVIADMRGITASSKGAIKVSELVVSSSDDESSPSIVNVRANNMRTTKRTTENRSPTDDVHFKRAKYQDISQDFDYGDDVDYDDKSTSTPILNEDLTSPMHEEEPLKPNNTTTIISLAEIPPFEKEQVVLDVTPLQCVPNSIHSLFPAPTHDWLRQGLIMGVKTISELVSNSHSSQDLLAIRSQVFGHLEAFKGVASIAKLNDANTSWFVLKVHEIFDAVDALTLLTESVDVEGVNVLSTELSSCVASLDAQNTQLCRLNEKSSSLDNQEKEILEMEDKVRKMREHFFAAKENLMKKKFELMQHIQLDESKKQEIEIKLERARNAKVEELQMKEALVQKNVADLKTFASI